MTFSHSYLLMKSCMIEHSSCLALEESSHATLDESPRTGHILTEVASGHTLDTVCSVFVYQLPVTSICICIYVLASVCVCVDLFVLGY